MFSAVHFDYIASSAAQVESLSHGQIWHGNLLAGAVSCGLCPPSAETDDHLAHHHMCTSIPHWQLASHHYHCSCYCYLCHYCDYLRVLPPLLCYNLISIVIKMIAATTTPNATTATTTSTCYRDCKAHVYCTHYYLYWLFY